MSCDITESAEFRLHIHRLLYNYAIAHLTTNYLTFTENLVSEFIEYLQPVPLTDPYSLVLSVDPFQSFSQLHTLSSLEPYDEAPQTTNEARSYLKVVMRATVGKPITERIAWNDHYSEYPPIEPFLPALTRRARRRTPKLGKNAKRPYSSEEYADLLKAQKIGVVPVEPVQEEVLSPEDILYLKCRIQAEDLQGVRSLLQTTTDMLRPQKSYKNKYLDIDYLRSVPLLEPTIPYDPFMPIFPKARLPRSGIVNAAGHLPDFKGFHDIPKAGLHKVAVEDPDGDISRQNLVMVDGWETIRSSPPSPPASSPDDGEDQLDELFLASSPDTEAPLVEELSNSKMEPILMPRTRQIGGTSGVSPHMLAGKTLATFLEPLFTKAEIAPAIQPLSEKNADEELRRPCSSPTPSSLLGQPPSEIENVPVTKSADKADLQDQDLDSELKILYAGHDLGDVIMKEALDDKQDFLMDTNHVSPLVPSLPEPNVHPPSGLNMPRAFSDFLMPPANASKNKDAPPAKKPVQPLEKFLKKVKGREPLTLMLSWIPFTVDKKLPSAAELVGVSELFSEAELAGEVDLPKMEALLKSVDLVEDGCDLDERRWRDFDASGFQPSAAPFEFEILRTRQERWRLARLENRLEDGMDSCEDEERREADADALSRGLQGTGNADPGLRSPFDAGQGAERPCKRARLDAEADMTSQRALPAYDVDMGIAIEQDWQQPASPAFSASDDKENWPPLSSYSSSSLPAELRQDEGPADYYVERLEHYADTNTWALTQACDDDAEMLGMDDEESFEPLSFGSRQPAAFRNNLPLAVEPEIASHSLGIAAFAQLRARQVSLPVVLPVSEAIAVAAPVDLPQGQQKTPQEIFDRETLRLPDDIMVPTSVHRYLASVDLIQKHALVRALRSNECAVELVERQSLDGVDLILDPHCAIIFLSLFVLPGRCDAYVAQVAQQSWHFSRILVVFEAYPEQRALRSRGHEPHRASSDPYAYTPPIVKAIKKFRRDVNIAEGCGTKCAGTRVEYAFANTVEEAALFARVYGDAAELRDETQGMIWGAREWLSVDFSEVRLSLFVGYQNFD
ncbi:hypothetical protein BJ912DRAFT_858120 [Pholiota molesta]|nr:hypothetical protein BJ912DRAFT_858120 [Pholiota molesta]